MSWDVCAFFAWKIWPWHMYKRKRFCALFRFREDIRSQSSNFSVDTDKPKYLFLPDCSFKICENPSKIFESVRGVLSVSAQSLTTLTPCPHSQRLNRHCGHVVNNYFSTCQHSQWLRRRAIFENFNLHLCYFFLFLFFYFSKVKNFPCFCVVIDYADKMPT